LADILAGIGTLAYHGTRLAVKGTILGTRLAAKGIQAGVEAIQEHRLRTNEVDAMVTSSASAADALTRLASTPGFEVPTQFSGPLKVRIETLVANNDRLGVSKLAHELRAASQKRLRANLLEVTAEACRKIGFESVTLRPQHGLLTVRSEQTPGRLTIEMANDETGGVKLHVDAHGFHGGSCVEKVNALLEQLTASGVRFGVVQRKRNDRSPAFDGRLLQQGAHLRGSR
ncbi:MAG: hypothetical protein KDL87_18490, partial [Verrucomicrobiae bacterium]|nr:hypothetical protein [Verrucomicrobiae bacterium]